MLPTVATLVEELDQVPPLAAAAFDSVRVEPIQTEPVFVIKDAGGAQENTRPESGLIVLLKVHVDEFVAPAVVAVQSVVVVLLLNSAVDDVGPLRPTWVVRVVVTVVV